MPAGYSFQVTTVIKLQQLSVKLQQLSSYNSYQVTTVIKLQHISIKLQQLSSYNSYKVTTVIKLRRSLRTSEVPILPPSFDKQNCI